jgi:2-methylcitrate dehydratase PrpD
VVVGLRDQVEAAVSESLHEDQARVVVHLRDGRTLERFVEHAVGSIDMPMSDADLEAKFRGLTDGLLSSAETDALVQNCWTVGTLPDASALARMTVPGAKSPAV